MISGNRHSGYTIVEVLIFLAISSVLLVAVMTSIGGQQRRTEFTTVVRDFDSKLQSIIDNVTTGYYNNTGKTNCTVSGSTITVTTTSGTIGQNSECTFIGQWISLVAGSNRATITSYAGLRRTTGANPHEVDNLTAANPTAITTTAEDVIFPKGVTIQQVKVATTAQLLDVLAITTSFNPYGAGGLATGSSKVEIHGKLGAPLGPDVAQNPKEGIQICLTDGEQVGVIFLTSGSSRVTIGKTCP